MEAFPYSEQSIISRHHVKYLAPELPKHKLPSSSKRYPFIHLLPSNASTYHLSILGDRHSFTVENLRQVSSASQATIASMAFHRLIPALLLLTSLTSAQQPTLLPSTLPACARTCPVLIQAQTGCVPPAAPVTDAGTYQSCFCQSGYLAPLKASSANICAPQCPDGDFATINTWYKGFCAPGAAAAQPTTIATLYPSTTTSKVAKPSATTSAASAPVLGVNQGNTSSTDGKAWCAFSPSFSPQPCPLTPTFKVLHPLALGSNAHCPLHRPHPPRRHLLPPP